MDIGCQDWMSKINREKLPTNLGRILEVGSLNINGSAREYFKGDSYLGIDMIAGKDVDQVMNGHDMKEKLSGFMGWEQFDTIICMNTFEHDDAFWKTLEGINFLIKQGGYFIFAQPTIDFPIHSHPDDYWRLTESALRKIIFKGYEILDIETVYSKKVEDKTHRKGWRGINPILCGLGRKQ